MVLKYMSAFLKWNKHLRIRDESRYQPTKEWKTKKNAKFIDAVFRQSFSIYLEIHIISASSLSSYEGNYLSWNVDIYL